MLSWAANRSIVSLGGTAIFSNSSRVPDQSGSPRQIHGRLLLELVPFQPSVGQLALKIALILRSPNRVFQGAGIRQIPPGRPPGPPAEFSPAGCLRFPAAPAGSFSNTASWRFPSF